MKMSGGGNGPGKASEAETAKQRQIGERIRRLRTEKLRLDQGTLAKWLGVSHGTVSYWERGGNATPANLRRLASVSGVSLEWLVNGTDGITDTRLKNILNRMMTLSGTDLDYHLDMFERMLNQRDELVRQLKRPRRKPPPQG
jgi:transcriptional regulator with XRE-family HTH domain